MLAVMLSAQVETAEIRCPAYAEDPPWRPMTCWILSRMGEPPDRDHQRSEAK